MKSDAKTIREQSPILVVRATPAAVGGCSHCTYRPERVVAVRFSHMTLRLCGYCACSLLTAMRAAGYTHLDHDAPPAPSEPPVPQDRGADVPLGFGRD